MESLSMEISKISTAGSVTVTSESVTSVFAFARFTPARTSARYAIKRLLRQKRNRPVRVMNQPVINHLRRRQLPRRLQLTVNKRPRNLRLPVPPQRLRQINNHSSKDYYDQKINDSFLPCRGFHFFSLLTLHPLPSHVSFFIIFEYVLWLYCTLFTP